MHSSHEFRSLKAKIRVLCKQRRIRLEEFMKTFDVHRVKKIKTEQFKRALDVSGLHLSTTEVNLIVVKYRLPDDPSFVDYRRFCDLMDKVFTVKGLEAKPAHQSSIHSVPEAKFFAFEPLTPSDEALLRVVKQKLFAAVMNKGIVLKDVFHDFDRSNAGKVTRPQFVRDISDIAVLSSDEMDVLLKAYSDKLDVHYRALHFDICPSAAGAGTKVAMPRSPERRHRSAPGAGDHDFHSSALQELEAELSELVLRDRIRTKNFFTDFDQLRTGKCTEAQFRRCVKLCFPVVTEHNLNLLVQKYGSVKTLDTTKVDYVRFCNCIEGKANRESLKDNNFDDILATITKATNHSTADKCSRAMRGSLTDSDAEVHQAMMQRLHTFCSTRRVLLKPTFQDFDKGKREHITVDQFFRVMAMFKLTLNSDSERRALLQRYSSSHGERFVNYVTFCYDLENWGNDNQRSSSRPSSRGGVVSEIIAPSKLRADTFEETTAETHVRSVPMLIRYIKQTIKRDRIRLEEYYRDFDKLRHGKITAAQFCAGLNAAGFLLSREEMSLLGDEYACKEVDSMGKHWIAWKAFVDDVESVFTMKGLEQKPHHDLKTLETREGQFGGVVVDKDLTPAEEDEVKRILLTMKRSIDRQRMEIKPAFEDFDRSKQGFISATKFERVLSMFALLPAQASESRLLLIKFREQAAMGTSATLSSICDVNYRAFLQALQMLGGYTNNASSEDIRNLVLPGSVAFRQELYQSGIMNHDANKRRARDNLAGAADLSQLLAEIRRQLSSKRIRLKEFIAEGDKLRSGEITVAKFHTALNRSGCVLDAADIHTLSLHFRSTRYPDKIDWRAFMEALDFSHGVPAPTTDLGGEQPHDGLDESMKRVLERLRNEVNHRRLHMKPYFQDYDHNNVTRVTKFQFAAVLDMMQLSLKPAEVQTLTHQFAHRDGRKVTNDVNYIAFIQAVDSDYS
ncbi:hypothetical protein PF010_g14655 [Phytophthora fragariae]|uniref:EF-hand domain-containing protein n=3 Tax=Phytophthora fragariae TaxID=53985 RepID=A0A6G0KW96_9STRA|nr:hypothetical protein PF010_g14655 [Phytophthora fragariae]KAE9217766.1 hypothetical protein PF004_g14060 [Phytophthora fragariae]